MMLAPRAGAPPTAAGADEPQRLSSAAKPRNSAEEIYAEVAPLWRRVVAWSIDGLTIATVLSLYLWVASAVTGFKAPAAQLSGLDKLVARAHALQGVVIPGAVLGLVLALAYTAAFAVLLDGRTLGRWLAGIRLVDGTGVAPTPTRAVIRALLSTLSFGLFLGGFWLALFDRRGQTLHDKLTSTFVVRPG